MATWQCVKNCGACCYLEPGDRPHLNDYLTPEELHRYLDMVADDGWCVNYDRDHRECRIYADRPAFCRVEAGEFERRYGVEPEDLSEFAIDCCQEHITDIYGDRSLELVRFNQTVGATVKRMVRRAADDAPDMPDTPDTPPTGAGDR